MGASDRDPLLTIWEQSVATCAWLPAVRFRSEQLGYADLDARAWRLASMLRRRGVRAGDRVGLCLERGLAVPVALLAVLRSGAGYVPLDPRYPAERLAFMLEDSAPRLVLTQQRLCGLLPCPAERTILLDELPPDGPTEDTPDAAGAGVAYVIYTSGSTGQPKGVVMGRRALANLIAWQAGDSRLGPGGRTLQYTPLSFDVHFQEYFATWATGGTLVLVDEETRLDPVRLLRTLDAERIERLFLPFVALHSLAEAARHRDAYPAALREIITAGEQLRITPAIEAWFTRLPGCTLANHYGPSETHVVTACTLRPETQPATQWPRLPPIGKALPGVDLYLLDEHGQPVADGEAGELVVGGIALADGYLNRPELTAERFITLAGQRVYRTGDLVRRLPDGVCEYLGRLDGQVKVRGHRVELGEVELALLSHPSVAQAAVTVHEPAAGDRRLVAHVVVRAGAAWQPVELREHVASRLPDYMVPAAFVAAADLPRTPSGKIDRRALPAPPLARAELATEYVAPAAGLESTLAAIWAELLGLDRVGARDNFFELGGDSLLAARMLQQVHDRTGHDVPIAALFHHPNVAALAAHLAGPATPSLLEAARRQLAGEHGRAVAIVGMAGRFPGAADVEALWANLLAGVESIRFLGDDELDPTIPAEERAAAGYVRAAAVLDDVAAFDAGFFGITPREAELMDPQQRLFLETAWHALEHAGHVPEKTAGTIGIFAGEHNNTYREWSIAHRPDLVRRLGAFQTMVVSEKDYLATRTAHALDLTGPAVSLNTACSTSLVAVVQAVHALLTRQCDVALAGGVTVLCPPHRGYVAQEGAMLSPDGHTRPFDAGAAGTVFGSGVGVVVLRRLDDAVRDGDTIHAVIRGAAINNDGSRKVSFSAPAVQGQAEVIARALAMAGVEPDAVGYIEAHGTATPVGDPVEVEALTQVFREQTERKSFCILGSLKGNVGHLVAAAGVAGLIKATLALRHGIIPPTLHFATPNPRIDWANSPFRVAAAPVPWPRGDQPRCAGVSSFGVGGTNAHVLVEEAPATARVADDGAPQLLPLSARCPAALEQAALALAAFLRRGAVALADVAWTLQVGRRDFAHRRFVVARTATAAADLLERPDSSAAPAGDDGEAAAHLHALGQQWLSGAPLDLARLHAGTPRRRVPLPLYPYQRRRCWVEPLTPATSARQDTTMTAARSARLLQSLRELVEEASGLDLAATDPQTTFLDLGIYSLLLTQVALEVQQRFKVKLSFRQLLEECPSLAQLADLLDRLLPPEPAAAPPPPTPPPAVAPAPVAPAPETAPAGLQAVIEAQLQLMARQLELLRGAAAAPPLPAAAVPVATNGAALNGHAKPFGAQARITLRQEGLTEPQRWFLADLTRRYTARTGKSKEYTQRHRTALADPRVVSGFRPETKEIVYPIVVDRARGARLWDVDGNEYLDLTCGFGSCFFGHRPDFIAAALHAGVEAGYALGPQHPLAAPVVEAICRLTGHERAALCNTGSEAVLGALRLARTVTGRSAVALFQGAYHGINDEVIVRPGKGHRAQAAAAGIPSTAVEQVFILDYGEPDSLKVLRDHADELAAVLVEPVQSRHPDLQPRDFLHQLRQLTADAGSACIFDEVITGFRLHPRGAQAYFGVTADLCTYGKVIGGGLPIGVIAGKGRFLDALDGGMWQYGDDSIPQAGVTYFAGTFVRHPLALAAASAVVHRLEEEGPALQEALNARAGRLVERLNRLFRQSGAPLRMEGCGSLMKLHTTQEGPLGELLYTLLRLGGLHIWDARPCFLTTAHSDADVEQIVLCFSQAITELQAAGFYPPAPRTAPDTASGPPVPGARLGKAANGQPAWFVPDPGRPGKYLQVGEAS